MKQKRILVVDDNSTFRRALVQGLVSLGFQNIETAVNGDDALRRLGEKTFDLVISDIRMPLMNGYALLANMKNSSVLMNIPVVLMSATSTDAETKKAVSLGAAACMIKANMGDGSLLEVIQKALE